MDTTLQAALLTDEKHSADWLFLSKTEPWALDSAAIIKATEEVPPEEEDDESAGYPREVLERGFVATLPMTTVEDVVANARQQLATISAEQLLEAFLFYYDNDAFIELTKEGQQVAP